MSRFNEIELDEAIVRRLMRGDRKAQEIVYRAYANAVYTMARRMLRDEGLAEEAAQDTFIDVLTRAATLERPGALGGWIRTIAVNQCLMRLRSPWQRRRNELDTDANEAVAEGLAGRAVDVDHALGRLAPDARMVVWLHCIEGFTHDEIAAVFGRTPSFSKSKLRRAYRELAEHCGQRELGAGREDHERARGAPVAGAIANACTI